MGWEDIAAEKRARIEATIPQEWRIKTADIEGSMMNVPSECGLLSKTELSITESSATELVSKLASGGLKSVDVTRAFCKRAAIAHQLVYFAIIQLRLVADFIG